MYPTTRVSLTYTLLTLGRSFKFISKTAILVYPIIGWAMLLLGTIPLKRMDTRSQLDCLKQCIDLVNKGASVFFFPEGTRSKDGKLGSFKKGAFSIAAKTRVPVVPITLKGTGEITPSGMEGFLHSGSVKVVIRLLKEATLNCCVMKLEIFHLFLEPTLLLCDLDHLRVKEKLLGKLNLSKMGMFPFRRGQSSQRNFKIILALWFAVIHFAGRHYTTP